MLTLNRAVTFQHHHIPPIQSFLLPPPLQVQRVCVLQMARQPVTGTVEHQSAFALAVFHL
jgi:hypothetical protein